MEMWFCGLPEEMGLTALNSYETETVKDGEVVCADDKEVVCYR